MKRKNFQNSTTKNTHTQSLVLTDPHINTLTLGQMYITKYFSIYLSMKPYKTIQIQQQKPRIIWTPT